MMPERRMCAQRAHSAEKARDTTLDDEKYDVRYRDWGRPIGKNMSDGTQDEDVMTALCNQPEAFASDLGDDQSRYLFVLQRFIKERFITKPFAVQNALVFIKQFVQFLSWVITDGCPYRYLTMTVDQSI